MSRNNGVEEISGKQFNETISSNDLVIVDFFAEWCMPCIMMAPVIDELAEKFKDKLKFVKVNVDDNSELSKKFSISSIPTLVVFEKGEEKERLVGALSPEAFEEKLESLIK